MALMLLSIFISSVLNLIAAAPTPQGATFYVVNPSVNANFDAVRRPINAVPSARVSNAYFPEPQTYNVPIGEIFVIYSGNCVGNNPANSDSPIQHDIHNPGINLQVGPPPESTHPNEPPNTGENTQIDPIIGTISDNIRSGSVSLSIPSSDTPAGVQIQVQDANPSANQQQFGNYDGDPGASQQQFGNYGENYDQSNASKENSPESTTVGPTVYSPYNPPWEPTQDSLNRKPIQYIRTPWPRLQNPSVRPQESLNLRSTQDNQNSWSTHDNLNTWSSKDNFNPWPAADNANSNNPSNVNTNRNWLNPSGAPTSYDGSFGDSSNFGADTSFKPVRTTYNSASNYGTDNPANGYWQYY